MDWLKFLIPSEVFLENAPDGAASVDHRCDYGRTRPILAEVQALVTPTAGLCKRTTTQTDFNRAESNYGCLRKALPGASLAKSGCLSPNRLVVSS